VMNKADQNKRKPLVKAKKETAQTRKTSHRMRPPQVVDPASFPN
jgi:hypothetical protein